MGRKIVKYLIYAQVCFFFCLMIDVFITTKVFDNNRGLSYFGEHINTAVPFALGFILCDFFLLKAARLLPEVNSRLSSFTAPLNILAILLISIVLTPDNLDGLFNVLHIVASSSLFLFELLFAIWLAWRWHNSLLSWFLVVALFLAGVATGLSQLQVTKLLSLGSIVYQLIFGILLVWVMFNVLELSEAGDIAPSIDTLKGD